MESTLKFLGFTLDAEQPHMSGERFLMMKDKSVLVATDEKGRKVIVKIADIPGGQKEIEHEKQTRDLLKSMVFANDKILFPTETYFGKKNGYLIWATEFVPQEKVYVAHTLEEQFFLILKALEEQEAFHATTFEHLKSVDGFFPVYTTQTYLKKFEEFKKKVSTHNDKNIIETLEKAEQFLVANKKTLNKYVNYLTHTDFVPHNFRVRDKSIYMLDLSAVHFGNKYEGWARFLNYMVIHNPKLEKFLADYVRENRGEEEYFCLRLMRVYKLGFLLDFYVRSLNKTEGNLKELTLERIDFWHQILKYILNDEKIPENFVEEYKKKRDDLRSEDEKKRQREFAIA
ncbi:MAG: hypothetical protein HYS51_00290 [Candidatus Zambryskibacteria bacterium]|nr:hypothetical protein [Candidatus Zambryskibacteria bacterium]